MHIAGAIKRHVKFARFKKRFSCVASALADGRFTCKWQDRYPCLNDSTGTTGFDAHYVYHTAWAARVLSETKPERHVDIGSCLRFVTLVSAYVPIDFYDWRPADLQLDNLRSFHGDITNLPFEDCSVASLSCMHVVEHIGLERYGEPLDPKGDLKAMRELKRVLAPGGMLIFAVPISGKAKIQYNAHRIYRFRDIICQFKSLELANYALITDLENFIENASEDLSDQQQYGCGCFLFKNCRYD